MTAPARLVCAASLIAVWERPPPEGSVRRNPPARFGGAECHGSLSALGSDSPEWAIARPAAIDSTNAISATPAAAGRSGPIRSRSGAIGVGRPDGTLPVSATSRRPAAPIPMPAPTAISEPGTFGAKRLMASRPATVAAESKVVGQLISPRL